MDIKYTTDGKKVRIVGKLNSQETIVQEIYVSEGNEIPSGENFIVKSLLDQPGVSWKERRTKEIEDAYEATKEEYARLEKDLSKQREFLRKKLSYTRESIANITAEAFDTLTGFLVGDMKYLVNEYYQILPFDKAVQDVSFGDNSLRLVSLYGNSKGDLTYKINTYSDGSGGNNEVTPCRTLGEAIGVLKGKIDASETYGKTIIKSIEKYSIPYDKEKYDAYYERKKENLKKSIEGKTKELTNLQEELNKIK